MNDRTRCDCLEHRLHVGLRLRDGSQDLVHRGFPVGRLGQGSLEVDILAGERRQALAQSRACDEGGGATDQRLTGGETRQGPLLELDTAGSGWRLMRSRVSQRQVSGALALLAGPGGRRNPRTAASAEAIRDRSGL